MCFLPVVNRKVNDVQHLQPPSSADMKNEWSCTSKHPICLHGVDRDTLKFFFKFNLKRGKRLLKTDVKAEIGAPQQDLVDQMVVKI